MIKEAIFKCSLFLFLCILLSCVNKDYPIEEVKETDQLLVEDVVTQLKNQVNDLQSVTIDSTHSQIITKGDDYNDSIKQIRSAEYTDSPFSMYNRLETNAQMWGKKEEQSRIEHYMTDELAYLYNSNSDVWMEVPIELKEDLQTMHDPKAELTHYLTITDEYTDTIDLEESPSEYVITIEGKGMDVRSAVMQSLELSSLINDQQSSDIVNHMEIKDLQFSLNVDKETNMLNKMKTTIQLTMKYEGEQVEMDLQTELTISDYNATELTGIPDEIVEGAEEYKMELGNIE